MKYEESLYSCRGTGSDLCYGIFGEKVYTTAYGETASAVKGLVCTYLNVCGTLTMIDSYDD